MAAGIELELTDHARGIRKRPPADFVAQFSAEHMVGALADRLATRVEFDKN